jgi:hypothetical protein
MTPPGRKEHSHDEKKVLSFSVFTVSCLVYALKRSREWSFSEGHWELVTFATYKHKIIYSRCVAI